MLCHGPVPRRRLGWYIHLNNDTPGTDDGLGWGFADGISSGVHVTAGQLIGWVGDSGNAEWTASHLHFELHHPDHGSVNPYPHLREAVVLPTPFAGPDRPPCPEGAGCDTVAGVDESSAFHLRRRIARTSTIDSFLYGNPGDDPLMGDWDCDGLATPAMYRPTNGFMYLRNSNTQGIADLEYFYGDPADIPLAGDWNGDGCDTLAIYRADEGKIYVKNSLGTGVADLSYFFGNPGDRPFAGDFDGDGIDTLGLYREDTGFVYFRNDHSAGPAHFQFYYGNPSDQILAGDWDGDGDDTVAVYRPSEGVLYVNLANEPGAADYSLPVGEYASLLTASPFAPGDNAARTAEMESCVLDGFNEIRTGRPLRMHEETQRVAREAARDMAEASSTDLLAAAEVAEAALTEEMGISYWAEAAAFEDPPSCEAIVAGNTTEGSWSRSFIAADANTFAGTGIAIHDDGTDERAHTVVIVVRAFAKWQYEKELGTSLTDEEYELLITEGIEALG